MWTITAPKHLIRTLFAGKRRKTEFGTKNFRKAQKFIAAATTAIIITGFAYYTVEHFGLKFLKNGNFIHSAISMLNCTLSILLENYFQ